MRRTIKGKLILWSGVYKFLEECKCSSLFTRGERASYDTSLILEEEEKEGRPAKRD
jgi:hypothetical protein